MTIPFLGLFNKVKARLFQPSAPVTPVISRPVPTEKPTTERLSKTVMPNTTRTVMQPDPFQVAAGPAGKLRGRDIPPAVALAIEPVVERAIALQLGDVLGHVPAGYVKPAEGLDPKRGILLKASEIEKGMASGQPTVSLASIYEQAPEIFLRTVSPGDATQIHVPYDKVLQQISAVQVRADQMQDQSVPQVETPILQVTLEDSQRFGTAVTALQTSAEPPVRVEPATAKTISIAEPEPIAREKIGAGIGGRSISGPSKKEPARIPFHLPPNGTGAPASERVPASSSAPVPTSAPTAAPARIPFKISPPCADLRPKFTLVPGVEPEQNKSPEPAAPKKDEVKIALALGVVMQNVPAFQLSGSTSEIPPDVRIELPYSLIEPQLASGRAAVDPKIFQAAIPEAYRGLFVLDPTETPVLLPLQEVLKNLPDTALKMRRDQEEDEAIDYFDTPFSKHAEEDAQRFQGKTTAPPKPIEREVTVPDMTVNVPRPDQSTSADKAETTDPKEALAEKEDAPNAQDKSTEKSETFEAKNISEEQSASEPVPETKPEPEKEEKNDAKEFVSRASALPGVAACCITFADGLSLAGNFPPDVAADGLCAMAPSLLQRIDNHMLETNLGALSAITLICAKSLVSFFMRGNVCLAVLHRERHLQAKTQQKLAEMVKELSHIYAQPEAGHVDH